MSVFIHLFLLCRPWGVVGRKYLKICTSYVLYFERLPPVFSGVPNELNPRRLRTNNNSSFAGLRLTSYLCTKTTWLLSVGEKRGLRVLFTCRCLFICVVKYRQMKASVCSGGGINHPKPIGSVCGK